jgi:hypothetical protein
MSLSRTTSCYEASLFLDKLSLRELVDEHYSNQIDYLTRKATHQHSGLDRIRPHTQKLDFHCDKIFLKAANIKQLKDAHSPDARYPYLTEMAGGCQATMEAMQRCAKRFDAADPNTMCRQLFCPTCANPRRILEVNSLVEYLVYRLLAPRAPIIHFFTVTSPEWHQPLDKASELLIVITDLIMRLTNVNQLIKMQDLAACIDANFYHPDRTEIDFKNVFQLGRNQQAIRDQYFTVTARWHIHGIITLDSRDCPKTNYIADSIRQYCKGLPVGESPLPGQYEAHVERINLQTAKNGKHLQPASLVDTVSYMRKFHTADRIPAQIKTAIRNTTRKAFENSPLMSSIMLVRCFDHSRVVQQMKELENWKQNMEAAIRNATAVAETKKLRAGMLAMFHKNQPNPKRDRVS